MFQGQKGTTDEQRFHTKYDIDENGCWIWKDFKNKDGYGRFWHSKLGSTAAHRYSLLKDSLKEDKCVVCHTCDVRSCVNPDHLYRGTNESNSKDMIERKRGKGQIEAGENHPMHKLTWKDVEEIRILYSTTDLLQREIAKRYNISKTVISRIVRNEIW